ncbi:MAG: trigger factor [Gemmatimonadetes bacterium]|nr:trigger factor [Gemmatimonadota bacterium]
MSTLDASRLEIRLVTGEGCRRSLEVAVPIDYVEDERRALTRRYASRMKLKGFRKGRVPGHVIAQRYGPAIEEEAVERLVRQACDTAMEEHELRPVTDVDVNDVRLPAGGPLSFTASFEVRPTVPLGRIGGFQVEHPGVHVPDEAVDRILERLRGEHAAWRTATNGVPEPGDSVTVALTRLDIGPDESDEDGPGSRQYDFILGQGQALPDIEDAVRSLVAGGADEFDIGFPDDFPDENRRGQSQRLRIELLSRRVPELPELDDAFARTLGNFEDIDTLRARIGDDLEREARSSAESEVNNRLMHLIVEANPFEVPESMVTAYTDALVKDIQGEEGEEVREAADKLREEIRPTSELAVRRELLSARITDEHGLHASGEEVDARVEALARSMDEPPARVRARLRKSGALRNIERGLTEAKLFAFLREQSDITGAPDEGGS